MHNVDALFPIADHIFTTCVIHSDATAILARGVVGTSMFRHIVDTLLSLDGNLLFCSSVVHRCERLAIFLDTKS